MASQMVWFNEMEMWIRAESVQSLFLQVRSSSKVAVMLEFGKDDESTVSEHPSRAAALTAMHEVARRINAALAAKGGQP